MKVVRVAMLTTMLFVGASTPPLRTTTQPVEDSSKAITKQEPGDCYFVNGIWICDP